MSTTILAHPDNCRVLLNRVWQNMRPHQPRPTDAEIMFTAAIRVVESPYMAKHKTVRLDLHEPPPRFIEYEKSDEDWLRYFGYIKPFEYVDQDQMLFVTMDEPRGWFP